MSGLNNGPDTYGLSVRSVCQYLNTNHTFGATGFRRRAPRTVFGTALGLLPTGDGAEGVSNPGLVRGKTTGGFLVRTGSNPPCTLARILLSVLVTVKDAFLLTIVSLIGRVVSSISVLLLHIV